MEENTELADNRLIELQKLQQDLQTVHQENNNMKVDFSLSHTQKWLITVFPQSCWCFSQIRVKCAFGYVAVVFILFSVVL